MSDASALDQLEQLLAFGIAERVRPDDAEDPWSQLADGTLSVEQAVARAQALDPEASLDDLRWQATLFAPASEDERNQQLHSALALRFSGKGQAPPPRGARPWKLWVAAAGLAAAASLALLLTPPRPAEPLPGPLPGPLPEYASEWASYSDSRLGDNAPATAGCQAQLHPSRPLRVDLRPATTVNRPVGVVAWAQPPSGPSVTLPLEFKANEYGFISATAPMSLHSGPWTVTFVIGAPDRLAEAHELATLPTEERPDVVVLREVVCVVE